MTRPRLVSTTSVAEQHGQVTSISDLSLATLTSLCRRRPGACPSTSPSRARPPSPRHRWRGPPRASPPRAPARALRAAPAPSSQAAGSARISGTVKNAEDDRPLARARVTAVSPGLPEPRVAITGGDGSYAIADLPPGAYTLTATRTGFAPYTYGQGRAIMGT